MDQILFNSLTFLWFIFAVLIGILAIKNRRWQHLLLLAASYFFYSYSSGMLVVLLLFSTMLDFHLGKAIHKSSNPKRRKFYLILSLIGNLGLLGVFKYTNFAIESVNYLSSLTGLDIALRTYSIVLPIGISFYTFQTLSYTFDIYRKKLKPTDSLLRFGLFVAFFPQLVAGPIVRAADFMPQLTKTLRIEPENFKSGLTLVGWGLVKKIVFADNIAVFVNTYFADPTAYATSIPVFIGALAFGIQIYCDFSGYSDIAIGVARMLGVKLRLNFDKPYFAVNVADFWRKWHISLSTWLRDYLYIPLGGSRKGKVRTYVNLMITMILGGLWHGAAWNFLAWGFYQGVLLAIHKLLVRFGITRMLDFLGKYTKYASLIITQYFVFLGWLLFRVYDVGELGFVVKKFILLDFAGGSVVFASLMEEFMIPFLFLGLFIAIHIYTFFNRDFIDRINRSDMFYWTLYLAAVVLAIYFLSPTETIPFIYFQF